MEKATQKPSFLTTVDEIKASKLQEALSHLSTLILYIHKMQMWTCISPKYYNELDIKPDDLVNKANIYDARINQERGLPNLKFIVFPHDTVIIHIINREHPFPLSTDQDVSDILVFLGRVKDSIFSFLGY